MLNPCSLTQRKLIILLKSQAKTKRFCRNSKHFSSEFGTNLDCIPWRPHSPPVAYPFVVVAILYQSVVPINLTGEVSLHLFFFILTADFRVC